MSKPNIVIFYIDDMGYKDLGCYGSTFYETPNIDRLAQEGMLFTDAYASCPVCSPSRASLMSGKYPARLGLTNYLGAGIEKGKVIGAPYVDHLSLEEYSLAKALKAGGYTTWHVGKWHLGEKPYYPEHHGFDVNIGGCSWGRPVNGYFSPWGIETLEDKTPNEFLSDRLTDEALNLIKTNTGKPFFLNFWHYAVHTPIQAKEADILRFKEKAKKLGLDQINPIVEGEHFPCEHKKNNRVKRRLVQSNPEYAALIYNLDYNIGRIIQALKDEGIYDNTLILFSSDNGGLSTAEGSPTSNAPLAEGKGWMYDGGVREPLIVKWTGVVRPGSICYEPVMTTDIYPTFLEAAGLSLIPSQHKDGVSMMPLLKGEDHLDREAIFWHYPHYGNQGGTPGCSVRSGDYKLIRFFEDDRLELYNLRKDISEKVNLVNEYPEKVQELNELLENWLTETGAAFPVPNTETKKEN